MRVMAMPKFTFPLEMFGKVGNQLGFSAKPLRSVKNMTPFDMRPSPLTMALLRPMAAARPSVTQYELK